ncbi:N-succinylarginine dihydrolase [Hirschia litorea]|uniref:N-succinylarginine dihydrolase n=1 Tax=Hirschia litorea TaxID=1199156 RepID=A0ABW2IHR8_9PROT
MTREINIDGLVGPTHNYGGMSFGNLASKSNKGQISTPKGAALQGLSKMRKLIELGLTQAVMPPQERPFISGLRKIGFQGSDSDVLQKAFKTKPALVSNYASASCMWTANAATVSPSADTADGKVHFTPANLTAMAHRSIEGPQAETILRKLFSDENAFKVHAPLPSNPLYGDEGAANHNRLCANHGAKGLEVFVYGREALNSMDNTAKFPARQSFEASQAVSRLHGIPDSQSLFVRQSNRAIDAGAFHNDVVCVANGPALLFHETAFDDINTLQDTIRRKAEALEFDPVFIAAMNSDFPVGDAIQSYFFNSQLITLPDGKMALILPADAEENTSSKRFADACITGDNPIEHAIYMDLRQSMRNGGGPACLRLRVQLTDDELGKMHQPVLMTSDKISRLETWVKNHYRDALAPSDLGDPQLLEETRTALDELSQILELGSIYEFQSNGGDI